MGISRDSRHKRSASGAKRAAYRKKRAFELGRQPANTRIGPKRIHTVRTRGGNHKYRALRLDSGNFAWASEGCTRKTRVINVVYHASNNELVRTNTLTKSAIIQVDAAPFRQWYEAHYGQPIGRRKQKTQAATAAVAAAPAAATITTTTTPVKKDAKDAKAGTKGGKDLQTAKENTKDAQGGKEGKQDGDEHKQSKAVQQKLAKRFADRGKVDPALEKQFESGRLYAAVTSRPGQSGRVDGQILEGAELAFYLRKLTHK